jgi:hypothetical protein
MAAAFTAVSAGGASAATIVNSFDNDAEGWTASGGNLTWQATGGNTGGYISMSDGNTAFMQAVAGSSFLGDLSVFDGGTFSFDAIQTAQGTSGSYLSGFGIVRLSGGGISASLDVFTVNPTNTWQTAAVLFDAATWGLSQSAWDTLLSNVTSFRIETESWNNVSETVGLDNIRLSNMSPIPVPAAGLLLLSALGALGVGRRLRG